MIHSQLPQWKIKNKRIFLRADLNVPLNKGAIINDFRLTSILPTLDYLLENNNMVILATHIGKPKNREKELSTEILIPWFQERQYTIRFAPTITDSISASFVPKQIVLLENLRFFPGEQTGDAFFARQLAQAAEYYVNDAFGTLHKHDCSISLLPYEFQENKRTVGFLIEKELHIFDTLLHKPQKPFIALLGGNKLKEKIPLIKHLLPKTTTLCVYPALCFSFLKAQNIKTGKSLVEETIIPQCKETLLYAENNHIAISFPQDYQIAENTIDGKLSYTDATHFPDTAVGISIGPKTVLSITQEITEAQTIFFNCAMGFAEKPETQQSTYALLQAIANAQGISIVAGGDSIQAAFTSGAANTIDHLSTGGGAALAYLGGNQLPGLIPFEEYT